MYNNLIKVNEMLAFAKNNEGVISLLLKNTNDYAFEDIINKEKEIDDLSIVFKNKNEESENVVKNNKQLKKEFISSIIYVICTVIAGLIFSELIMAPYSEINIFRRLLLFLIFTSIGLYLPHINPIKDYKKYKNETKNPKEAKEDLERVRELLNSKKEELEKMLDKVDYKEYTNKEEIASVLNEMIGITPSNEQNNALNKDLGNNIDLDGPVRGRKR